MNAREADAFRRGIEQFNREEFFAAHETWEAVWLVAAGADKVFLQGIIQIAAAFHHWRGGNRRGALSLLCRGIEKITPSPRSYRGICVDRLREEARRCAEALAGGAVSPPGRLPRIDLDSPPFPGDSA